MDGQVVIGATLDTKSFDAQITQLEHKLDMLEKSADESTIPEEFRRSAEEARELNVEIEKTRNQLTTLYRKQAQLNKTDMSGISASIKNAGSSLEGIIKKTVRWGLAIFGVRSAYMFIRQEMGVLSQYNKTIGADIEYMRWAIATSLKPIIEKIIQLAYKLLAYINYIAQAWFGVNLFANASAKNFEKAKKSIGGANKEAKKLNKTLAGFDEMNILQKDGSTKTGGGGGGIDLPTQDLANLKDIEIPAWIKWIADHKAEILTTVGAILGLFTGVKVAKMLGALSPLTGAKGLGGILSMLGKIVAIGGSIAITGYIAYKFLQDVKQLKSDIQNIRDNGAKAQEEWIKNEENINNLIKTGNVNRTAGYELLKKVDGLFYKITGLGEENLKTAKQTAINIGGQVAKSVELYKQGKLNNEEQSALKQNIIEQYEYNLKVIDALREQGWKTGEIEELNKNLIQNYQDMGGQVSEVEDAFGRINAIKFDKKTIKVDADTSSAELKLDKLGRTIAEAGFNMKEKLKKKYGAKGMIYTPPKLAVGGIINQPGRGVPIGSAYGGERGAEGVIPLTDSQQMSLLGEAIGRYITVNLTNVTQLDGRQIARKVDKIQQNNNFVLNR